MEYAQAEGLQGLWQAWPQPSLEAWLVLLAFGSFQAVLQRYAPGKRFEGPVTPNGNIPVYKVTAFAESKELCWGCDCLLLPGLIVYACADQLGLSAGQRSNKLFDHIGSISYSLGVSCIVCVSAHSHYSVSLTYGLACRSGLWNPGRVYDLFGEMLAALNTFSLVFCVFLNVKVGKHSAAGAARICHHCAYTVSHLHTTFAFMPPAQ